MRAVSLAPLLPLLLPLLPACSGKPPGETAGETSETAHETGETARETAGETARETAGETGNPSDRYDALRAAAQRDLGFVRGSAVSIAILQGDSIVFAEAFGVTEPDGATPVDADSRFPLGPPGEVLTAAGVLDTLGIATADDAALDEPIAAELFGSSIPAGAETLTLRHLLSRRSGLRDATPWHGDPTAALPFYTVDYPAAAWVNSPPGELYAATHADLGLAAALAELRTGTSLADRLSPDLVPLADADNAVLGVGVGLPDLPDDPFSLAPWAITTEAPVSREDTPDPAAGRAWGWLWGSPRAFLTALAATGRLADVCSDQGDRSPDLAHLRGGLGAEVESPTRIHGRWYPVTACGRAGSLPISSGWLVVLPELDWAVVLLSNGFRDDYRTTLDAALATAPLPAALEAGPAYPWDPAALDGLAGRYVDPHLGTIDVARDGDGLRITSADAAALGVAFNPVAAPLTTHTWTLNVNHLPYPLTFVSGEETRLVSPVFVGVGD